MSQLYWSQSFRPLPLAALLITALLITVIAASVAWAKPAGDSSHDIYAVVYSMLYLPAYRVGLDRAEFDPAAIIALIEKSVTPESLTDASIGQHPENLSLVICQTQENHERVAKLLSSLRKPAKK